MTAPAPPSGAVIIADVVGTAYVDVADAGAQPVNAGPAQAFTHRIITSTNFPQAGGAPSDFSNLMVNAGTLTIGGGVASRYDTTSATGHHPTPDVDVGTVKLGAISNGSTVTTGWESARFALSGATTFYNPPLPTTANCTKDATTMNYGCVFAGNTAGTAGGVPVTLGVFPAVDITTWTGMFGQTSGSCDQQAADGTTHANLCEQRLFYLTQTVDGGVGGTTIGVDVPGGMPYNGAAKSVNIPESPYITSIKQGTTTVCTGAGCKLAALTSLDKTKDLIITWSCDPNNQTTTGAGCSGKGPFELFNLVGLTSTHTKGSFSGSDAKQGTLTCIEQAHKSDATMTVPTAAWTAMIGSQTGGSITLNFLRVSAALAQLNPNQLYSAGTGQFIFLDLP